MCKSKAEGGKRCHSHTMKDLGSVSRQIETQERLLGFLSEREEKAGQLTLTQQAEREQRTEKLRELKERAQRLETTLEELRAEAERKAEEKEQREAERREKAREEVVERLQRGHQGEGAGRPRLNLTPTELTDLKEEALGAGKSVSKYVQDLLDNEPVFDERAVSGDFKRFASNTDTVGRKPQSSHGATIDASPTVGMSAEKYDRLTAEAEAFGLTTADYLRRRILRVDPRVRGAHMSVFRQDAEIDYLTFFEEEAGLGENPTRAELWSVYSDRADKIQETRRTKVRGKEKPKAA